jgi:GDSL-like Lipase/Acylhydrolase family
MQTKFILAPIGFALSLSIHAQPVNNATDTAPPALPKTMVSMGDSITAGAVAGLSRSQFYNPFHLMKLLGTLGEIAVKWSAYGAIQDRHLSWASGLNSDFSVKSHAHRLAYLHAKAGTQMQVGSVSWSGDTSFNLEQQVTDALAWNSARNPAAAGPDYVTLLIGANDICADSVEHMSDDRDIYNNVDTAVSRLVSANPNVKVVISSLPDVNSLNTVAKHSRLLGVYPYQRCEDFWRKVNLCRTLTRLDEGSLDRHIVGEKVVAINRMLSEITERVNTQTQNQNVIYSPTTYEQKFTDKDISIDCFHPNQRGQNMLAEATWNDGFWAEGWSNGEYDAYVKKIKKERAKKNRKVGPPHRM